MNDYTIDPEYDEREFEVSESGRAMINEVKALWASGVPLDEISIHIDLPGDELTMLLSIDYLRSCMLENSENSDS